MSKSKKILSIALALVMVLGVFSICSFAVSTNTATVTLEASAASVGNSETVTITVKASSASTFYAGPMSIPITYDSSLFTLGTATINDVFGSGVTEKITNTATAGKVVLVAVPKTDGAPVAPNLTSELTIATITFTSAASGTGTGSFAIYDDQKTTSNPTGTFYIGEFDGSDPKTANLETIVGTLTRVPVDVAVGAVVLDLELTATGTSNGVVIDTNKTFGGAYAGVVYGFPQAAANTFRTIAYITTNLQKTDGSAIVAADLARTIGTAGYGTGTTITVGSKVYVIVIFGDVDGNGLINAQDTTAVKGFVNAPATLAANSVNRMAANCQQVNNGTMLHTVNAQDTTALKAYVNNASNKFSPATLASYQNSKNNFYQ